MLGRCPLTVGGRGLPSSVSPAKVSLTGHCRRKTFQTCEDRRHPSPIKCARGKHPASFSDQRTGKQSGGAGPRDAKGAGAGSSGASGAYGAASVGVAAASRNFYCALN